VDYPSTRATRFPDEPYFIGSWTGDGTDDLITRDNAGTLHLCPFRNGTFYGNGCGTQVGHGFHAANYLVGHWTGDGTADLVIRDSTGTLSLCPFRNDTFYGNGCGAQVGHGFHAVSYLVGDWASL
jgi:hypothetical protein